MYNFNFFVLFYFVFLIFFYPYNKNLNTLTLNFLLSPIEISLNWILSFYVFLVFLYVRSSILIGALHISKSKKSFNAYSNCKRVIVCIFKKSYILKAKIYYQSIIFLSFTLTSNPTPKCLTILIYSIFFYSIDITYKHDKLLLI